MEIIATSKFSVYEYPIVSPYANNQPKSFDANLLQLQQQGYVVLPDCISENDQLALRTTFQRLLLSIQNSYDVSDDGFESLDREVWSIARLPRIGNGKHNMHFDAFESQHHAILADLVHTSGVIQLLRGYLGSSVQLRETGLSVTRPCIKGVSGDGMEWHSDGSEGECTMLMSIDDISPITGSLCISPASQLEYKLGEGHTQIDSQAHDQRMLVSHYQSGSPVIIDARTLHKVTPNNSTSWRFVVWFIFDSY